MNSIYMNEAAALRKAWGAKPCEHPSIARERETRGAQTGDFICEQCGAVFLSESEWEKRRENSQENK